MGSDHPEVATILNNLAESYSAQRQYGEAKALYERVLAIDESVFGPEHPEVATDLSLLGSICESQGNYVGAEALYQRVVRIRRKALPPEHPLLAKSLSKLENARRLQSRMKEAPPAESPVGEAQQTAVAPKIEPERASLLASPRASKDRRETLSSPELSGPEQVPDATPAPAEGHEGPDYQAKPEASGQSGQLPPGSPLERMIFINVADLDIDPPAAVKALMGLGGRYVESGRLREAEGLYEKMLTAAKLAPTESGPFAGAALNNLGLLLYCRGKKTEGLVLVQQALAFWLSFLGTDHPHVAAVLNNLASFCMESGNVPEAEALYHRSLVAGQKSAGPATFPIAVVLNNLRDLHQA